MHIYTLLDPRSGAVRYVGKTGVRWLCNRREQHLGDRRDNPRTRWLRELKGLGLKPLITPIQRTDGEDDEAYWIALYRAAGHDLLNATNGGAGTPGKIVTQASRDAIASKLRGKKRPPEVVAKVSAALKGRKRATA